MVVDGLLAGTGQGHHLSPGGKAANFLDFGGGIEAAEVTTGLRVVLTDEHVRAILLNILGGIARCDVFARGLVEGLKEQ